MDIRFFDTLESTNAYCKLLDPKSLGEFTVVWAGNQTAGIGQKGNVWCSEPYKNLTFSIILKPSFLKASDQWLLSMTLALAITDSLIGAGRDLLNTCDERQTEDNAPCRNKVSVKWPNDIYIGDRKVCGILITNQLTSTSISQSICGIGLNVNQTTFPDWIPNPTSISIETGKHYDLKNSLDNVLGKIESRYSQLKSHPSSIKPDYMSRLYRLNKPSPFLYDGRRITATIIDVDSLGHLHLTTEDDQEIVCDLKEIKFVI